MAKPMKALELHYLTIQFLISYIIIIIIIIIIKSHYILITIAYECLNFATVKIVVYCIVLYIGVCVSIKDIFSQKNLLDNFNHYFFFWEGVDPHGGRGISIDAVDLSIPISEL